LSVTPVLMRLLWIFKVGEQNRLKGSHFNKCAGEH